MENVMIPKALSISAVAVLVSGKDEPKVYWVSHVETARLGELKALFAGKTVFHNEV